MRLDRCGSTVLWGGQTWKGQSGHSLNPRVFSNEKNKTLECREQGLSDFKGLLGHFSFAEAPCVLK